MTQTGQSTPAGTAEHAMEKARGTAQEVQQQAGQKAQELKSQAGGRIRTELDSRSTQAGEQLSSTADAFRRVGQELRGEQKEGPARLAEQVADRAERAGRYLTETDGDGILRDLEQFARRRAWLVAVAGAAVGFLASRFVKASASRDGGSDDGRERALPEYAGTGEPATAAVGEGSFVAGAQEGSPHGRLDR